MSAWSDWIFGNLPSEDPYQRMPTSPNIEDRRRDLPQRPVTSTPDPKPASYPASPMGGKAKPTPPAGRWPSQYGGDDLVMPNAGDLTWMGMDDAPSVGAYQNSLFPGPYRPYNPSPPHPAPAQPMPDMSDIMPRRDPSIGQGLMNLWHAYWNGTL